MSADKHGSASGPESQPSEQEFAELAAQARGLIARLDAQAGAIDRLAGSVAALASAVAELLDDGDDGEPDTTRYLDGSPR